MLQKIGSDFKRPSLLKSLLTQNEVTLSFYDIVYSIQDGECFKRAELKDLGLSVFLAYTDRAQAVAESNGQTVYPIMLGQFIKEVSNSERINVIGINHNGSHFDNFVFTPFYDELTKQYLISPSDESIALLSIDKKTHAYMGVEATFFSINNKFLPDDQEQREELLGNLVDDLSFMIPRMTQPQGSANIICLLLNIDNPVEEKAFIRNYQTLDSYIEVLFVTSDVKLLTGELEEIKYNGDSLEGVYTPLIERRKNLRK
ncbi:hypothetical protein [Bacteriovorax sp. Seq25_V]|uniref:hypothetical protein n=1 Tax=Bacteriovorax sp. Seq25_V TaxID=1201288 RepID=UPI00038A04A9|nr:hypothetical protein [Bacteriovorax sp. Seq25_V]EQC45666.1 hypothetical protein M900_2099 [Bacteriovorax sp. Seq25_V]